MAKELLSYFYYRRPPDHAGNRKVRSRMVCLSGYSQRQRWFYENRVNELPEENMIETNKPMDVPQDAPNDQ
jgi:hypothetical protein